MTQNRISYYSEKMGDADETLTVSHCWMGAEIQMQEEDDYCTPFLVNSNQRYWKKCPWKSRRLDAPGDLPRRLFPFTVYGTSLGGDAKTFTLATLTPSARQKWVDSFSKVAFSMPPGGRAPEPGV